MLKLDIQLKRRSFSLNVSEQIAFNGICGVMGSSGCGKTTLLRTLAGLEKSASGCISWNEETWQDSRRNIHVAPEKRGIGYIFQDGRLFPHLDVKGNLAFAAKRKFSAGGPLKDDVIQWLGIEALLKRNTGNLSGGERQRVALARALLGNPRLLLLDEPLASLDWKSRMKILPVFRQLYEHFRIPVLMVSHDREEVARLVTNLLVMNAGRVVEKGYCQELLSSPGNLLADDDRALSVLNATVQNHALSEQGVTALAVDGQAVLVDSVDQPSGTEVKLVIPAHDVSLMIGHSAQTSIQNQLETRLSEVAEVGDQHLLLKLVLGEQALLALITRRAWQHLELKIGQPVTACFKAAGLQAF